MTYFGYDIWKLLLLHHFPDVSGKRKTCVRTVRCACFHCIEASGFRFLFLFSSVMFKIFHWRFKMKYVVRLSNQNQFSNVAYLRMSFLKNLLKQSCCKVHYAHGDVGCCCFERRIFIADFKCYRA